MIHAYIKSCNSHGITKKYLRGRESGSGEEATKSSSSKLGESAIVVRLKKYSTSNKRIVPSKFGRGDN